MNNLESRSFGHDELQL